uniref:ATP synthase F0 subunit 8 n=1 Tax=Leucosyrinx sp. MNHN IM 2013-19304 TaxID=2259820 RepID=A0A344H1X2_9CAEN|nr:ATP synthase F0 subunit 8 [Leucosyrinx sp. MNHN IM 2013-19304]AXA45387.1 ATP synthase F0 subunit 8 [Leucosyrinx sp. MNHN IM 2013-19304]
MPQLSPLNWILLFLLFWSAVLSLSVLIWWSKKIFFKGESLTSIALKKNKWNW